jgi:hypothetical protein
MRTSLRTVYALAEGDFRLTVRRRKQVDSVALAMSLFYTKGILRLYSTADLSCLHGILREVRVQT